MRDESPWQKAHLGIAARVALWVIVPTEKNERKLHPSSGSHLGNILTKLLFLKGHPNCSSSSYFSQVIPNWPSDAKWNTYCSIPTTYRIAMSCGFCNKSSKSSKSSMLLVQGCTDLAFKVNIEGIKKRWLKSDYSPRISCHSIIVQLKPAISEKKWTLQLHRDGYCTIVLCGGGGSLRIILPQPHRHVADE